MKHTIKLMGFAFVLAAIVFAMVSCGGGGDPTGPSGGNGGDAYNIKGSRWQAVDLSFILIFSNSTYECKAADVTWASGTYTVSGNIIKCESTDEDLRTITIISANVIQDARGDYWNRVN